MKKNSHDEELNYFQRREANLMEWVGYWRKNPQIFVKEYLGINLFWYQKLLIYMMNKSDKFVYIAARGQGKSWLIAIYCIARCILYPGTQIVLAAGTKGQAGLIITEKIKTLYKQYPAIRFEIGDERNIATNANKPEVEFANSSKITAVPSADQARGYRANILILDEFRLIKPNTYREILHPFLNVQRKPGYSKRPEYSNLPVEENKEIFISSAWYKTNWSWPIFKGHLRNMISGNGRYFAVSLPYQLSVFHKLLSDTFVKDTQADDSYDPTSFRMEYAANFVGENNKAYYKLDPLNKIRTVAKTFNPPTNREFVENKMRSKPKVLSNFRRVDRVNEIRLVALDIALMGGNKNVKNDTSAFTLIRLIRSGRTYKRQVVYLESIRESIATQDLAIRLKQLYYDFEADYVVMDANGNGLGVFDACATVLSDKERGVEYPAWASMNDKATNERTNTKGLPIVYTVKASSEFNHEIAVGLKNAIETGKLQLPIDHMMMQEQLQNEKEYRKLDDSEKTKLLYPYLQTTALINELVSLEYEVRGVYIRIKEVGTATKDRYSSLAYGNYYANVLENELREEHKKNYDYYML